MSASGGVSTLAFSARYRSAGPNSFLLHSLDRMRSLLFTPLRSVLKAHQLQAHSPLSLETASPVSRIPPSIRSPRDCVSYCPCRSPSANTGEWCHAPSLSCQQSSSSTPCCTRRIRSDTRTHPWTCPPSIGAFSPSLPGQVVADAAPVNSRIPPQCPTRLLMLSPLSQLPTQPNVRSPPPR